MTDMLIGFVACYLLTGFYYGLVVRANEFSDRIIALTFLTFFWPFFLHEDVRH